MPKIKLYHVRTLLWTYLVWAILNLSVALLACKPMPQHMRPDMDTNYPLERVPIVWVWLHIAPLLSLRISLRPWWPIPLITGIAGFALVAGLLINRWWACFLVIAGMSIWFFWAICVLGLAV